MQFTCESCKTILQIADDKVRGKRLVVRCKRCGAKIGISDPLLAGSTPPRLVAGAPAPAPRPASAPPAPRPVAAAPPPRAEPQKARRPTDTESTRAMDSDLLERALEASKQDEPLPGRAPPPAHPAPAADAQVAPPEDAPDWFAMIAGKQTGPMTRAEVEGKVDDTSVGPRTYLWKEGMASWQRAKDVPELAGLFGASPEAAPIPAPAAEAGRHGMTELSPADLEAGRAAAGGDRTERELSADDFQDVARPAGEPRSESESPQRQKGGAVPQRDLSSLAESTPLLEQSATELASWASDELSKKGQSNPRLQKLDSSPQRRKTGPILLSHGEEKPRTQLWIAVVLGLLIAAAFAGYSTFFGAQPPAKPSDSAGEGPPPEPGKSEPKPKEPAPLLGLTADQVRRKLDENKGALQGCIDDALKHEPNLKVGKIHIATTIAPSGTVTSTRIDKRNVDESALGTCLKRATRRIAFPPFHGDPFDVDIPIVVTASE